MTTYTVQKGRVGRHYCKYLTLLFQGVHKRKWNSECPMMYAKLILQTTPDITKSCDVRSRLDLRMALWEKGRIHALIDDVIAEVGGKPQVLREKDKARSYQARVISGQLRFAVHRVTSRAAGGVLQLDDMCTKTGQPVLEALQGKHPKMREPNLNDPNLKIFEEYPTVPQAVPLDITAATVEKVASHLSGAAGPSGTDAVDLSNWLLRHGAESQELRGEMACMARYLANEHPPWAAYRALMACRLVALDKEPGTRPVGIGEIYRRLIAKCVLEVCGSQATTACGNLNLCAGLPAGIEGAVHAMTAVVADAAAAAPTTEAPQPPATQEFMTDEEGPTVDTADSPHVTLLVDARNGFNELGRKTMLWTVRHTWAAGFRFAFNCYRHVAQLIVRRAEGPCSVILSEEGITQGDPLSMILYGLALAPLGKEIRDAVPGAMQAWYADDCAMGGKTGPAAEAMTLLERLGPARGY